MGVTVPFQSMTIACDDVLKFDWHCQLSGSVAVWTCRN